MVDNSFFRHFSLLLWTTMSLLLFPSCKKTEFSRREQLDGLREQFEKSIKNVDAQIGIALIAPEGDTLTVNNNQHYPLMSVFKFHQALAVAHILQKGNILSSQKVHISPEEVQMDTYSPMRGQYPHGNIDLSISELWRYTLQLSDNLACDILFDRFISPCQTDRFLKERTNNNDFQICHNEAEMGLNYQLCYENWTTPYAAASLMRQFLDGKIISAPYLQEIKQNLEKCQTGQNKLAKPIKGTSALLGHKTGGGQKTPEGRSVANNDVGFVTLADGRQYVIAIFIKDAMLTAEASDSIIARLSHIAFQHFNF